MSAFPLVFITSHTSRLIPRAGPARVKLHFFAIFFFSEPFISNLAKGKTGGNRRRREEMGRGQRMQGGGHYNKKNRSGYSAAGKSNFNTGKGFPAAGPASEWLNKFTRG